MTEIKLNGQVSGFTKQLVRDNAQTISAWGDTYRRPFIKVAERKGKDSIIILVNSGTKTDFLDMNNIRQSTNVLDFIFNNVRANGNAVQKGINYHA